MNDHIMKWFLVCLSIAFLPYIGNAQDIEVKKFEPLEKDLTAALNPRKDINGVTCGLVKVLLKEPGAEFEGSVMGDVQFTGKEYLVYLPNGTKRLGIKHPDYLPTTIVFADYGTKKVASGTTYELKVKTNKKKAKIDNSKKGMAVFNIKPSNAMLLIDGEIADGSGGAYTLSLTYGTHYYTVKLKDFSITNQTVKIDKNAKTIDVDLTEYFAKVKVDCHDGDAEIIVNDQSQGMGKWEGFLVPGECVVNIIKNGYHPLSKTIELMENDTIKLDFPALKMISGFLKVNYLPKGSDVLVNGKKIGVTPLQKELPVGDYKIDIKCEGYLSYSNEIKIADGKEMFVNGEIEPTQLKKLFMDAEGGDANAQLCLAYFYMYGSRSVFEDEFFWDYDYFGTYRPDQTKAKKQGLNIEKNIYKGVEWLKKSYSTFYTSPNISDNDRKYYSGIISYWLMTLYLEGNDIKQDFSQSYYWANRINYWKPFWMAWHYYYGRGVNRNVNMALYYLKQGWECTTINREVLAAIGREVRMIKDILDIIGYN